MCRQGYGKYIEKYIPQIQLGHSHAHPLLKSSLGLRSLQHVLSERGKLSRRTGDARRRTFSHWGLEPDPHQPVVMTVSKNSALKSVPGLGLLREMKLYSPNPCFQVLKDSLEFFTGAPRTPKHSLSHRPPPRTRGR